MYGVAEAGIVAVGKVSENAPLLTILAFCVAPLMVTEIISPLVGYTGPLAEIIPERLIEVVPNEIVCEGVNPLNADPSAWTVTDAIKRNCWLLTVTVATLM